MASYARKAAELSYLFDTESPFNRVADLARAVATYGPEQTYERKTLIGSQNAERFQRTVASLTLFNLDVILQAPDLDGDKKSDFYDFTYSLSNLLDQPWVKT